MVGKCASGKLNHPPNKNDSYESYGYKSNCLRVAILVIPKILSIEVKYSGFLCSTSVTFVCLKCLLDSWLNVRMSIHSQSI